MGLPKINIEFKELGVSAIQRSERGVVALILKDDTGVSGEFTRLDQIKKSAYEAVNHEYLTQVFLGAPSKVIVEVISTVDGTVAEAVQNLSNQRFDYLAMPSADSTESTELVAFIKSMAKVHKLFKLVTANEVADSELVINFTTDGILVGDKTYSAMEYTARIAGILAGLPLTRSATYYVLPEVEQITSIADEDKAINDGQLILINDGEKIKIARAVNSLTTTSQDVGESFKKIKIVEGLHLFEQDIRSTFEDNYIGKYINNYDNKVLFTTAVSAYATELERDSVLDSNYDNRVEVSVESQRLYLEAKGMDTSLMTEQEIKEYNTGSDVFLQGNLKFVDAMEDLKFVIHI